MLKKASDVRNQARTKSLDYFRAVNTKLAVVTVRINLNYSSAPFLDYGRWSMSGVGTKSGWIYAHCGEPCDERLIIGLLVIKGGGHPDYSATYQIKMPEGAVANMIGVLRIINVFHQTFFIDDAKASANASKIIQALKDYLNTDKTFADYPFTSKCVWGLALCKLLP